uniref:Uncharacterized protein n=1 Tax=Grammatophora oceanica TaxID=210454 RepID=A0A7S1UYI6_9STRA
MSALERRPKPPNTDNDNPCEEQIEQAAFECVFEKGRRESADDIPIHAQESKQKYELVASIPFETDVASRQQTSRPFSSPVTKMELPEQDEANKILKDLNKEELVSYKKPPESLSLSLSSADDAALTVASTTDFEDPSRASSFQKVDKRKSHRSHQGEVVKKPERGFVSMLKKLKCLSRPIIEEEAYQEDEQSSVARLADIPTKPSDEPKSMKHDDTPPRSSKLVKSGSNLSRSSVDSRDPLGSLASRVSMGSRRSHASTSSWGSRDPRDSGTSPASHVSTLDDSKSAEQGSAGRSNDHSHSSVVTRKSSCSTQSSHPYDEKSNSSVVTQGSSSNLPVAELKSADSFWSSAIGGDEASSVDRYSVSTGSENLTKSPETVETDRTGTEASSESVSSAYSVETDFSSYTGSIRSQSTATTSANTTSDAGSLLTNFSSSTFSSSAFTNDDYDEISLSSFNDDEPLHSQLYGLAKDYHNDPWKLITLLTEKGAVTKRKPRDSARIARGSER